MNWVTALFLLLPAVFGDQTRGWVRKLLANRYLLWLGMTSYAFYLWHLVILNRFIEYDVPGALGGARLPGRRVRPVARVRRSVLVRPRDPRAAPGPQALAPRYPRPHAQGRDRADPRPARRRRRRSRPHP